MKERKFEELKFTDDYMFCKILTENKDICKEVVRLILGCDVKDVVYPDLQKSIEITSDGKGIRLDVYLEDGKTVYDIEMQTTIGKDLPKRSRYYQGMIDLNLINRGAGYSELREAYVVFICLDDLFEKNRSIYTFKNVCIEDNEIELQDASTKVFVNAAGSREGLSRAQIAFLDYVAGREPSDDFTKKLNQEVYRARNKEEWRREYMTLLQRDREKFAEGKAEGMIEGKIEGKIEGRKEAKKDIIEQMIRKGKSPQEIADFCGFSIEEVTRIQKDMIIS